MPLLSITTRLVLLKAVKEKKNREQTQQVLRSEKVLPIRLLHVIPSVKGLLCLISGIGNRCVQKNPFHERLICIHTLIPPILFE